MRCRTGVSYRCCCMLYSSFIILIVLHSCSSSPLNHISVTSGSHGPVIDVSLH
ncbi:hypothetical protein BDR03DRAFT_950096 [Suillus americanus]|nr:hypothetical protein BDR03DRAFT_950096 [Suillus americanus]